MDVQQPLGIVVEQQGHLAARLGQCAMGLFDGDDLAGHAFGFAAAHVEAVVGAVQAGMQFNPMASLIQAFQVVMMQGRWPDWSQLWFVAALGVGWCLLGFSLFRRHAGERVDEL